MSYFSEFNKISKSEWEKKIFSDLKEKKSSIKIEDEIEELNISSYYHSEDVFKNEIPGNFPFTRGMNKQKNDWKNGSLIIVSNEKESNKKALLALNSGADLLVFKTNKKNVNWKAVFKDIKFEFIYAQFIIESVSDFDVIFQLMKKHEFNIQYKIDIISNFFNENFNLIAKNFKHKQKRFCSVNGHKIHQIGGNTWQEIAFCLNIGHEYLIRLMNIGFSIDEAAACISFNLGVGSNYFFETAKFRALRKLWSKIINAYDPIHDCSYNCDITAVIGHMNKSLKDPYTNLLRQTTEVMSAINGGSNAILVEPYDIYSMNGSSEKSERMALNISNILKEESYFDIVIDPLGGSYSIEMLTDEIARKGWKKFQDIEGVNKGVKSELFINQIKEKANLRINNIKNNSIKLIGINAFKNPKEIKNTWKEIDSYLGLPTIILETV